MAKTVRAKAQRSQSSAQTRKRPSSLSSFASFAPSREKLRILITAGPTREYIDPVRFLSNDSSGKMGFAIASEAGRRGHRVTLIHGPVCLPAPFLARTVPVVSAADMLAACEREWPRHDVLFMVAAVADYRPVRVASKKIRKKHAALTIDLEPTADILARLSSMRRADQIVIGFALEDRNRRRHAEDKLRRKNLDAIVLNQPSAIGAARSTIEILIRGGAWQTWAIAPKVLHAKVLTRLAESLAAAGNSPAAIS